MRFQTDYNLNIMSEREFDFTIFGATHLIGKHVLRNLVKWLESEKKPRWIAIAGKSKTDLESLIFETSHQMDRNLNDIGIVIADPTDETSLIAMAARSKVILNTCEPFAVYGEQLVKACIKKKTHLLDIAGNSKDLELIQLKYHEIAKTAGIYIIGSCSFNAIPADIGIDFLKQQFLPSGRLNSVETFITISSGEQGFSLTQQTLENLVDNLSQYKSLRGDRKNYSKELFRSVPPKSKFRITKPWWPWKTRELNSWAIRLPIIDQDVISSSQLCFYETYREHPASVDQYFIVTKFYQLILLFFGIFYLTVLSNFRLTRKLLLNYPRIVTFGLLSTHDPSSKQSEDSSFTFHFVGRGWDQPSSTPDGQYKFPPNKTVRLAVLGPDPVYETTSLALIQCGFTVLEEYNSMPFSGGCMTPACAFRNTSLRNRLHQRGLIFKLLR